MKKVLAFLEKYAEWVAMGVACIFLLYMVYAYVVSPDDLRVQVGSQAMMPGEVDPSINANLLSTLEKQINDPKAEGVAFPVPDFVKSFSLAMSKERERMKPEYALAAPFRPGVAPVDVPVPDGGVAKQPVTALPVVVPPLFTAFNRGASLVKLPPPGGAAAAQAAGVNAAPGVEMDKTWVMWEGRIDIKSQAAEWKKALFDAKGNPKVPPAVLLTQFLRVEVEREEEIDPGTWGNRVEIAPLALAEIKDYPKAGDRNGEEEYRLWSEKHQADLVEPPFYQIVKGDEWFIPSLRAKEAVAAAPADAAKEGPFDPANPPKNRELTTEEKQKVYLFRQKEAAEKEKQEAAARKSKADSTRRPPAPSGGGEGGGGRGRKIGGYAPLPGEGRDPGQRYDDGGRPIGRPSRPGFDRGRVPREGSGRLLPNREPTQRYNPNQNFNTGQMQNGVPTDPFDPTLRVDPQGVASDIIMWVHDDTVVPGKFYRYRVKVSLKNPIYNTQGLAADPKFTTQLAITSDWSAWSPEIQAPPSTEYFFSRAVPQINGKGAINTVMVDVFKHEKGDWTQASFTVGPGDSIGRMKDTTDYNTGMTIVDIRGDLREKDTKIMVADEKGSLKIISFQSQLADKRYADLKDKVKAAAAGGPAAAAGTPSLINR